MSVKLEDFSDRRWSRRSLLHLAGAGMALGGLRAARAQSPVAVTYPNLNGNGTDNLGYRMLELALSRCGRPYTLTVHPLSVNDERARAMLRRGEINVVDFGSGAEFETAFNAIYFPIDRGLLGYRLSLIHYTLTNDFSRINNLAQLRQYRAGQGLGWSNNIIIMQTAGIPVVTGPTLESLFPMLEAKRFDYLPLGLNEVYGFSEQYGDYAPSMVVDEHLLLVYRFARLFYVRPRLARSCTPWCSAASSRRLRKAVSRSCSTATCRCAAPCCAPSWPNVPPS
ncbi:MAG: hypothetical protein U5M53_09775 [Rhodoferax sp.]|nr:hypothetical protein [Rhodoferax sp.]